MARTMTGLIGAFGMIGFAAAGAQAQGLVASQKLSAALANELEHCRIDWNR